MELCESLTPSPYQSVQVDDDTTSNDSLLNEEAREIGTVHFNVYSSYWKAIGHILSFLILISIILMQFSRNATDWWLSYWVTNSEKSNTTNFTNTEYAYHITGDFSHSLKYYMLIYILLACLNSLFTLIRAFLFAFGGITAAFTVHRSLLKSIMKVFDVSVIFFFKLNVEILG